MNEQELEKSRKNETEKKKRKRIKLFGGILGVLCLLLLGGFSYVKDCYKPLPEALEATKSTDSVQVVINQKDMVFVPEKIEAGLIFYPGAKVEYEAYAPLMQKLAQNNILCVLVHMPGNMAMFDLDAADEIPSRFPKVQNWYMAGHSLGGAMAAVYTKKHLDEISGIIFLAAYSTEDLSTSDLKVLSIYGSEDRVLNMGNYEKDKQNLPHGTKEVIIQGGCHAYFGMYGPQKGDGNPSISSEAQLNQTKEAILSLILQ